MKTSPNGIDLIKRFEGFSSKPYLCPADVWTIGYGATRLLDGSAVTKDTPTIDYNQGTKLLEKQLEQYELAVDAAVHVAINQNQFDAMVSLCYNIGAGNFSKSTLVKLLNAGNSTKAAQEFLRWNKVKGKPILGLLRRREEEMRLFLK
jgi:lysozyme